MSEAVASVGLGFWPAVATLLRLRLQTMLRGFRRSTRRRKFGTIVLLLVVFTLLGGLFALSWVLLGWIRSPTFAQMAGDIGPIIDSVPALVLGGAFLGILFTSFGVLLQALYLAGDMDFLLSAPIPHRAVYVSKLLQAILPNLGLIGFFGLPLLFGLGAAGGYNPLYYPMVVGVMVALALAAAGLASLLVMLTVRVVPARRVAEVLGFLGATVSILCSQSGQLANFNRLSAGQTTQALQLAARLDAPWSPLGWAGRGLMRLGEGRWLEAAGLLTLVLGLSAAVFVSALAASERLYYSGWARMQAGGKKKGTARPASRPSRWAERVRGIPPVVQAVMLKDFRTLRRDLRNMSQLVTPLILGIIYAIMLVRSGGVPDPGRGEAPAWAMEAMRNALSYGGMAIALFIGWSLLGRLAGMGFSQEGRNYWLLKSAPVRPAELLAAKFMIAYLPAAALGWGFLLILSLLQRSGIGTTAFEMIVVALCLAGATGINLAFGVLGANMSWEDPRQMIRGSMGLLSALVSLVYLPISLALFLGPSLLAPLLALPAWAGGVAGLTLGGAASIACAIAPPRWVRHRVPGLGEA
jgi:ABC-2 type transport system permease protein